MKKLLFIIVTVLMLSSCGIMEDSNEISYDGWFVYTIGRVYQVKGEVYFYSDNAIEFTEVGGRTLRTNNVYVLTDKIITVEQPPKE